MTSAQRVDFVVTGHIVNVQDGLTGEITAELDTYKGLKNQVPLLFSEKYIILARQKQSDTSRILLTAPFGRYIASTQLGAGGKLDREEIPNLKHILKKVGMNFEDKPQFVK
jgi:hypothetical protein